MKIAICDDFASDRKILRCLLEKCLDNMGYRYEISEFTSGEMLINHIKYEDFNLVFLDIYMSSLNGIETARKILETSCAGIVFTTGSREFAVEGFEIGAVHYLLKPYGLNDVKSALMRFQERFGMYHGDCDKICVKPTGVTGEVVIFKKDIMHIESFDKVRCINTVNEKIETYETLSKLMDKLGQERFIRPHRSFVVGLEYIKCIDKKMIVMTDNEKIKISRNEYSQVIKRYEEYVN